MFVPDKVKRCLKIITTSNKVINKKQTRSLCIHMQINMPLITSEETLF